MFGKDNQKLAKFIRTRNSEEVSFRIVYCARNHKKFPIHKSQIKVVKRWSKMEEATFINVIKKYGWNFKSLAKALPDRNRASLHCHSM